MFIFCDSLFWARNEAFHNDYVANKVLQNYGDLTNDFDNRC